MLKLSSRIVPAVMLSVATFCGCGGGDGPQRGEVTGSVTLNGQPVQSGVIVFTPVEGVPGPPTRLEISEGTYSTKVAGVGVVVGTNEIMISSAVPTGKKHVNMTTGQTSEVYAEAMPAKYSGANNKKETVEVRDGENQFDFHVEGKQPPSNANP